MSLLPLITETEELYARYHRTVYAYLLRLSGSADLAEDLLQETFYRAIRGAAGYRGEAAPVTWLCAIARHLWFNRANRLKREKQWEGDAEINLLPDRSPGPEGTVVQRQVINRVLAALPEQQRVALLLRDADGLSYEEVAVALGLTLANVKVTIHRARIRFRELYLQEKEA